MDKNILNNGYIIPKNKYLLLDELSHYEKKKIKTNWNFEVFDVPESYLESLNLFFTKKSLKEALKETFNISSASFVKFYEQTFLKRDEKYIYLNLNYFIAIKLLSELFLKNDSRNHNDFIKILSSKKAIALIAPLYKHSLQLTKFFHENFNNNQIADFLLNSSYFDETIDTLQMYIAHDSHMKEFLKTISWSDKNNFKKCHDIISKETTKINQKNFLLKQESFFNIDLFLSYRFKNKFYFKNPESFHDLIDYGIKLRHCIGSLDYAKRASIGECLLLPIYDDKNNLKYTVEILKNGHIRQIQGSSGLKPDDKFIEELRVLIAKNKILK